MKTLTTGTKVRINSTKEIFNGCCAVVDFQAASNAGVAGIVYLFVTVEGKRKPQNIVINADRLQVI